MAANDSTAITFGAFAYEPALTRWQFRLRDEKMGPATCVICKSGNLHAGLAMVILVRGDVTLVVKRVVALVGDNCGEEYADEAMSSELLALVNQTEGGVVQVDIREYVAA